MFFGGGCNNNSDSWIWIVVIVALVILCCDGNILAAVITAAVAVMIHKGETLRQSQKRLLLKSTVLKGAGISAPFLVQNKFYKKLIKNSSNPYVFVI